MSSFLKSHLALASANKMHIKEKVPEGASKKSKSKKALKANSNHLESVLASAKRVLDSEKSAVKRQIDILSGIEKTKKKKSIKATKTLRKALRSK